jgi:hypothetical protein
MEETSDSGIAGPPSDATAQPETLKYREPLADIVECWWADHFPGSPVAQVTQAWNHAFAAKEELKRRLVDLVGGGL